MGTIEVLVREKSDPGRPSRSLTHNVLPFGVSVMDAQFRLIGRGSLALPVTKSRGTTPVSVIVTPVRPSAATATPSPGLQSRTVMVCPIW